MSRTLRALLQAKGTVNAHFINDGMPANQPSPGESTCPASVPGAPGGENAALATAMRSAFFWPEVPNSMQIADIDINAGAWYSHQGCTPLPPAPLSLPASVNTLAGWSLGRLGPMYFLHLYPQRWSQDPHGSSSSTPGPTTISTSSDPGMDATRSSPGRRLTRCLLSGCSSRKTSYSFWPVGVARKSHSTSRKRKSTWGDPRFEKVLWNFYFHGLWHTDMGARAIVCDYDNLRHNLVLNYFYRVVRSTGLGFRPDGCPGSRRKRHCRCAGVHDRIT